MFCTCVRMSHRLGYSSENKNIFQSVGNNINYFWLAQFRVELFSFMISVTRSFSRYATQGEKRFYMWSHSFIANCASVISARIAQRLCILSKNILMCNKKIISKKQLRALDSTVNCF